jgi:hypothetical protein
MFLLKDENRKSQNKQGRQKPQPKEEIIYSQSIGLEGMDQCGVQNDFPVSVAVKRELTKL